ncbi:MFS transporter [Actinoplanes sp. RD1]|uniref:MFS transporter n=1 Tax=Actinoplanes sp. RD1 TaxID=3064538 RepID=UPI0027416A61|nr:MFS transporter [Actinoplanes sp. RD1]
MGAPSPTPLVPAGTSTPRTSSARARAELLFVALGALAGALSQSLLIPVLSQLTNQYGAGADWLLTSTLLVAAVAVPVFGRLADMFGKRLMLLIALAGLVAGSVITATTSELGLLILGRAIQGLGLAGIPLGISLLTALLPPERAGSAVALVSAMLGIGGALGLPLAGVVVQSWNFHALFWILAAAGLVAFIGIIVVVPEAPGRSGGRFDMAGGLLLSAALVALLLPLAEASDWGWGSPRVLSLLAVAGVLFVVLGAVELRLKQPLVDVRALSRRPIVMTNIVSVIYGFAVFGSFLSTAPFVQAPRETGYGFGASVITAGLVLLPNGLAQLILAPLSARLIARIGAPVTLAIGSLLVVVGYLLRFPLSGSLLQVTICTTVIGAGVGIGFASMPALINTHTPRDELAAANGLNSLFRNIGGSLGSAISASLLALITIDVAGRAVANLDAYRLLIGVVAAASAVAAVIALCIPRRPVS